MSEDAFNLIPPAYQRQRKLLGDARYFVIAAVLLVALSLLWWGQLSNHLSQHEEAVSEIVTQLRARQAKELDLQTLQRLTAQLEERLQTLDELRGGFTGRQLLQLIDGALNPGIRFNTLRFERPSTEQATRSEGTDSNQAAAVMRVNGDADNHVALGDFLSALSRDPQVQRVELQRSGSQQRSGVERVSFEVALRLKAGARSHTP